MARDAQADAQSDATPPDAPALDSGPSGRSDAGRDAADDGRSDAPADAASDGLDQAPASSCHAGEPCCSGTCLDDLRCARDTCSCIRSLAGNHFLRTDGAAFHVVDGDPIAIVRADTFEPLTPISTLSEAAAHACALLDDASVWCWPTAPDGNDAGELGNGSIGGSFELHRADRVRVAPQDGGSAFLTDVVALETTSSRCGADRTTCAVRRDGSLWCWGSPTSASLFNGGSDSPYAVPVAASAAALLDGVDQVSVGAEHACVIRDGAVECWGKNDTGALGTGDTADHAFPTPVSLPGPAQQVGASVGTTCARVADAVYCWGANDRGQLGIGSPTANTDGCALSCKLTPTRVEEQIGMLDGASSLVVGNRNACVLRTDGELHCWGAGAASFASPLQLADFGRVREVVEVSLCGVLGVDTDVRFLTPDGHVHAGSTEIAPSCP